MEIIWGNLFFGGETEDHQQVVLLPPERVILNTYSSITLIKDEENYHM